MSRKHSYLTCTDQFCGAGGSSIGAVAAGVELLMAMNHWKLAIETHSSNFPGAAHDCADMSATNPRRYPATDILITSPECTNHSLAKGKKRKSSPQLDMFGRAAVDPAEERSRATMWDVPRFAEIHRYNIIIVENVVDARYWELWDAWLLAMDLLGYDHRVVYFNSMHAHPTPQSRDRMYVVFWRKGNRAPNLDFHPRAYCARCERDIEAIQAWKQPSKRWGRYRRQYIYACPTCASAVEPYFYCAANAIDWSLPAPRIGDRKKPLKEKTLARIRAGLEKFARPFLYDTVHTARDGRHQDMVWPVDGPGRTQLGNNTHGLVVPPFVVSYYTRESGVGAALARVDESLPTQPTWPVHYLATPGVKPEVDDCGFRMLQPHEIQRAMAFPREYTVLGTQREKVKQLGNAVNPPVMEMLMRRCIESLE